MLASESEGRSAEVGAGPLLMSGWKEDEEGGGEVGKLEVGDCPSTLPGMLFLKDRNFSQSLALVFFLHMVVF